MAKAAIIVESPTKTRTLSGFLGDEYKLLASNGHVRDLPDDDLAVDVEHDFTPIYEIIPRQKKIITQLKKQLKGVEKVYLASDPDREGEAIAWHLVHALDLDPEQTARIEFNEITNEAVLAALQNPRDIDLNRVNAQQARRILDRLVGYEISPLLWRRIGGSRGGGSLSAGRVQSAALRLICDREREIAVFEPEESWSISVRLSPKGADDPFTATVRTCDGNDLNLSSEEQARPAADELAQLDYQVADVSKQQRKRQPQPPFITSTLQRQAANELGFSARKTMLVAEQLYQGVETSEGTIGLITYMRTDSTRVAAQAIAQTREYINKQYGDKYIGKGVVGKKARGAQDAHEAIRPTSIMRTPQDMEVYLDKDQLRLYTLIWRRMVASQMSPAEFDQYTVNITAGRYGLRATGSQMRFPGFLALLPEDDEEGEVRVLATLKAEQFLDLVEVVPEQHFSKPPPRFTEATLVQELEENGIGRPSTYASIIETLRQRKYVRMQQRRFIATSLGFAVCDYLLDYFPHIMDIDFTAHVEEDLDEIEEGDKDWVALLEKYHEDLQEFMSSARSEEPRYLEDERCPEDDGRLVIKSSVPGRFAGCENYPDCSYTKHLGGPQPETPAAEPVGRDCPECGEPLVMRQGRRGQPFVGCSTYPKCKYTESIDSEGNTRPRSQPVETDIKCPKCGKKMVVRESKRGKFLGCSGFQRCRSIMPLSALDDDPEAARKVAEKIAEAQNDAEAATEAGLTANDDTEDTPTQKSSTGEKLDLACEKCGAPMMVRKGRRGTFVACSGYPKCKNTAPIQTAYAAGYEKPEAQELDEKCPECGKALVVRESRRGKFVGCSGYPSCRFTRNVESAKE